jgi:drug/metabolite transporter (DMT)-like permease
MRQSRPKTVAVGGSECQSTTLQTGEGLLLGLIGVTAFGLTLPATRFVTPYLDPLFIGPGRAVVAALVAAVLLAATRQPLPSRHQLGRLCLLSLCVVVGFPIFSAVAMKTVPAAHGGVVLGILPLATALAGRLLAHERPSPAFWLVSALGAALVVGYAVADGLEALGGGDLALLGALVVTAVGYALGGQLSRTLGGWQVICWALVIGFPVVLVPAVVWAPADVVAWLPPGMPTMGVAGEPLHVASIPTEVWLVFLYLALVSQLFGFFFWNAGLALGGIARVSQTQLLQPFITIAASAWLLAEAIDAKTLIIAPLVVATVAIGRRMPVAMPTPPTPEHRP